MDETGLFFYPGDEIKVVDRIQTPHAFATVEALVAPGKEWAGEVWPDGLIVIEEE